MESRFRVHDQGATKDLYRTGKRQRDIQGERAIAGFLKLTSTTDITQLEGQRTVQGGRGRRAQGNGRGDIVEGDDGAEQASITSDTVIEGTHADLQAGGGRDANGSASDRLRTRLEEPSPEGLFDLHRTGGQGRGHRAEGDGVFGQRNDLGARLDTRAAHGLADREADGAADVEQRTEGRLRGRRAGNGVAVGGAGGELHHPKSRRRTEGGRKIRAIDLAHLHIEETCTENWVGHVNAANDGQRARTDLGHRAGTSQAPSPCEVGRGVDEEGTTAVDVQDAAGNGRQGAWVELQEAGADVDRTAHPARGGVDDERTSAHLGQRPRTAELTGESGGAARDVDRQVTRDADIDTRRVGQRVMVNLQGAAVDVGGAGVGAGSQQDQSLVADLGETTVTGDDTTETEDLRIGCDGGQRIGARGGARQGIA